jgi:hypothetical protein
MIHYGEEPNDEIYVTADAAQKGFVIENTGSDPLVALRYFGPDVHEETPNIGDHKKCDCQCKK